MIQFPRTTTGWQKVGSINPAALVDARQQLHWACQIPSAVGTTLLTARDDDSQTNLEWLDTAGVLAGEPVGNPAVRGALDPATLTLHFLGGMKADAQTFSLSGRTFAGGMSWMQEMIKNSPASLPSTPLKRRELDIPFHPVGDGGTEPFSPPAHHHGELARWFANGDLLQREFAAQTPHSSPVRCWPHHFDLGMLVSLEPSKGYNGKAIGLGISPGDDTYAEPYWYVNPYPAPPAEILPELTAGRWHTAGWVGAVLTASEIVRHPRAEEQAALSIRYLRAAVDLCTSILRECA